MGDRFDPTENGTTHSGPPAPGEDSLSLDSNLESDKYRVTDLAEGSPTKSDNSLIRYIGIGLVSVCLVTAGLLLIGRTPHKASPSGLSLSAVSQRFNVQSIPESILNKLSNNSPLSTDHTLSVNGQLQVNNSLVIAPTSQPTNAVAGQVYYDKNTRELGYYNGNQFTYLLGNQNAVINIGGLNGVIGLGTGLGETGTQLLNTGVLSLQGQTGDVSLSSGTGISITGTTISNKGVVSIGGQSGTVLLGNGLGISNGSLSNSGVISISSATPTLVVTNDGAGNVTLTNNASGGGTVSSPGGTAGNIAEFSNGQTIQNSILSELGSTVTVGGNLTITGSLVITTPLALNSGGTGATTATGARTALGAAGNGANSDITSLSGLTTALSVNQGGTGATSLATNGILLGNGTSSIGSLVAGSTGQCLISTAGAPTWQACPGGSGGVSASGATTGTIPVFTGSSSLGNSLISESGATVAITGTLSATALQGDGSAVTNVNAVTLGGDAASFFTNATNITSGTLADNRLSTNIALLNGSSNFTGTLQHSGNNVCDTSNNCGYLTGAAANGLYIELQSSTPGTAQTGSLNITGTGVAGSLKATTIFQNGNQVCDTSGNCTGVGGSVTTAGGTAGDIAIFTGSQTIGNSALLSESGTTVTVSGTLSATTLSGDGSAVTNVNATTLQGNSASFFTNANNITTGTLSDSRLSTNIALLNGSSNFTGTTLQHNGNDVCDTSNNCGYLTGSSASGSFIQLQGSTPGTAQTGNLNISGTGIAGTLKATTIFQNGNQVCDTSGNCVGVGGVTTVGGTAGDIAIFTGANSIGDSTLLSESGTTVTVSGTLSATTLTGDGTAITNVDALTLQGNSASFFTNATNITTGTLSDSRLSTNVALLSGNNNFTGTTLQHGGNSVCDASNNCGYLTSSAANGLYIQLQGSTPGTAQTGNINVTGTAIAGTIKGTSIFQNGNQVCDTSGNCTGVGGGVTTVGGTAGDIAIFTGSQTIGNSALLSEGGTTVTVGGTLSATSLSGDGTNVTNVNAITLQGDAASFFTNATNITTGTLSDSRLSTNVTLLNGNNNFTGTTLQHSGNNVCDASNNCGYLNSTTANGLYIQLQGATPGTAQTGNFNITGTSIAGTVKGTSIFQNGNQVCDTSGNCVGVGGGVTTAGGTSGDIAIFTGTNTISNSALLSESGTTVTVGGTLSATTLQGNGSAVTNVNAATLGGNASSFFTNATNTTSGTLADGRLSTNVTLLNGSNNFTGTTLQHSGNNICDASNNCGYLNSATANGLYIELQGATPGTAQTGNFNILGTGIATSLQVASTGSIDTTVAGAGVLSIGTTNATGITVGSTAETGTITLGQAVGTNTINIGNAVTGSATQTITIGNSSSSSTTTALTLGSTTATSTTTLHAGSTVETLSNTGASITASNTTHSTMSILQNAANATVPVSVIQEGATPGTGSGFLQFEDSGSNPLAKVTSTGDLQVSSTVDTLTNTGLFIGSGNSTSVTIGNGGVNNQNSIFGLTLVRPSTASDAINVFQVENKSSVTLFDVDTQDSYIQIGSATANTSNTLLILNNNSGGTDPTGVNGAMYYNTTLNVFRCYENNSWQDCIGVNSDNQRQLPFWSNDFYYSGTGATNPWQENVINTGAISNDTASSINHPGVIQFSTGASAVTNSGFRLSTSLASITLGGGENCEGILEPLTTSNVTTYYGYEDGTTIGNISNGVYFKVVNSTLTANTENSNTVSSSSSFTLSASTWYRFRINVVSTSSAVFNVYTDASGSTPVFTATLSTNIPTTNQVANGIITETTSAISNLSMVDTDYMSMWYTRVLTR